MRTENLKALAQIGSALWMKPGLSQQKVSEALSLVCLQDITEERRLSKVVRALLERASADGVRVNAEGVGRPFYRLLPEERLILSALHYGRWSTKRLAEALSLTEERVAEIAWASRLHLASSPRRTLYVPHANGSGGPSCPEYHPARPWTQKFLDEEMTPRQRHFIERHALSCRLCRQSLQSARAIYYAAQMMIPQMEAEMEERALRGLADAVKQTEVLKNYRRPSFLRGLAIFFNRGDVVIVTVVLMLMVVHYLSGR